ncbi:hypothetical protein F5888DRAFT_1809358 [Russula emetica]|nr:hypothetical protein F5888DRAFT_1809358 [Russula emetica]
MGDPTSPASAPLVLARRLSPTQPTGDEVKALSTAVEAVEDAFAGGVELVDPLGGAPVSCDVSGQPPIARDLAGTEHELEGGLRPSQEVQEPHGEGLPGSVLSPVSRGVVRGEGLEGVGVGFGPRPSHGSLGHGGVCRALADEPRSRSPPQVGDEEVGEGAVVGDEPVRPGGISRGDGGRGDSGSQDCNILAQVLDRGLIGPGALEEGAGGDLCNLPEVVGTPSSAEGL